MNIRKTDKPIKKISIFLDSDEEENNELKFVKEFGDESPKNYKIKNEAPLVGPNIKSDLKSRPDEPSINEYRLNPVHDFGVSLLKNMGWVEGQSIGHTNKGIPQPIEYIRRPDRLGLGAESQVDYIHTKSNLIKKNRSFSTPIYAADGKVKHVKGIHDPPAKPIGPKVKIIKGKYNGRTGSIILFDKQLKTGKIRLDNSEEIVILSEHHYKILVDDLPNNSKNTELPLWLASRLRVRIIDKNIFDGKYFNVKGTITSIQKNKCNIFTDDKQTVRNVSQDSLETLIPKTIGSSIMIVSGKYQGIVAKLVEKDSKTCYATVRFSNENHVLSYDSICEIV